MWTTQHLLRDHGRAAAAAMHASAARRRPPARRRPSESSVLPLLVHGGRPAPLPKLTEIIAGSPAAPDLLGTEQREPGRGRDTTPLKQLLSLLSCAASERARRPPALFANPAARRSRLQALRALPRPASWAAPSPPQRQAGASLDQSVSRSAVHTFRLALVSFRR